MIREASQPLSRWTRRALAAIVLLYVALAVLYSLATRFKWGPDEPAHFVYVQSLALDSRLPTLGDANVYRPGGAISHQRQQPPLYYALAALVYRASGARPADSIWRILRFFSIAIGLGVLAVQWRLLRLLFPHQPAICLAGMAVLAFLPMFTYITSVVNNDPMAALLFTAVIYQWCRILTGRWDVANIALAGFLVGLAVLTKESALALTPGLLILAAVTGPPASKTPLRRISRAALALATAAAVCGGWFLHNLSTHGTPTLYFYHRPAFASVAQALRHPRELAAMIAITAERTLLFLWLPWWTVQEQPQGQARIPQLPYTVAMLLLSAATLVGLVLAWFDRWRGRPGLTALQSQSLALMFVTVGTLALGILRYVLFVDYTALQAGRYFVVVWPVLAILGVVGLSTLMVTPRAKAVGLAALVGVWLTGNAVTLWLLHLAYRL